MESSTGARVERKQSVVFASNSDEQLSYSTIDLSSVSQVASPHLSRAASIVGPKTQSAHDGELVEDIVERTVSHVFQNTQLLKYRLLQSRGVVLHPTEVETLLTGEERDPQRRAVMQEELSLLRDAAMVHFYPHKRSQLLGLHNRPQDAVATNAYLLAVPGRSSLSSILRETIDVAFQQVYEEVSLRLAARQDEIEEHIGPNRRLNKAIGLQRDKLHRVSTENEELQAHIKALEEKLVQQEHSLKRREAYHKEQLNAYLKEVAVLKEQLYRTYRDKSYVGKDVDIMPPLVDDDTCEDVSVDQLLHYRRTMRGVEQHIAVLKNKVKSLEEDLEGREQAMQMLQEKSRARELTVANAQKELDDMNNMVLSLENDKEDLQKHVKDLTAEIEHLKSFVPETSHVAVQATDEEDIAAAYSYRHMETQVAVRSTKIEAMKTLDAVISERQQLKATIVELEEKARRERALLEAKCKALEQRAVYAEKRQEDLAKISEAAIARQDIAESHAAEVLEASAGQTTAVVRELKVAQDEVESLRGQNATLCLAYTGMWERLQALKTKAGLNDYKQRSNEHHFKRAEAAVAEANARILATEAKCAEEVQRADQRVSLAEHNLSFALEDVRCTKRQHVSDMKRFEERIAKVEEASNALLEDYNRLRLEHLRLTAESAIADEAVANNLRGARTGSASFSARMSLDASTTGPDDALSRRRRSLAQLQIATDGASRQQFAFEVLSTLLEDTGDGSVPPLDFPTKVQAAIAAFEDRKESATREADFGKDRKVRASQLPAMVAREFENALLCALEPLVDTLLVCAEGDAQLVRRAAAADAVAKKGASGAAAEVHSGSVAEYLKVLHSENDTQLLAMGLGEQREAVAWAKLHRIAEVERSLRECLERLHRVAKQAKVAPIDTTPLKHVVDRSLDVAGLSAHVTSAKEHEEAEAVQHPQRLKKSQAHGPTPLSSAVPSRASTPAAHQPGHPPTLTPQSQALQFPSTAAPSPIPIEVTAPSPTFTDASALMNRTLPAAHAAPAHTSLASTPLKPKPSTSSTGVQTAAVKAAKGSAPDSSMQALRDHTFGVLSSVPRDDVLLAGLPPNLLSNRPASTGGSPRSRNRSRIKAAVLLDSRPSTRAAVGSSSTLTTVASDLNKVGASAASDASLVADEVLAGVKPMQLRSAGSVESDQPFGNALSINKEYSALRERLETTLAARTSTSSANTNFSVNTTVAASALPPWKQFKQSRKHTE